MVHLWESGDETWRERPDFAKRPVCTGAETFMFIFAISYAQAISAFVNDGDEALRTEVERWEPEAREAVGSSTRRGRLSVLTSA